MRILKGDFMKNQKVAIGWIIKLLLLTGAIYWFMTKGFTTTVGEGFGIKSNPSLSFNEILMYILMVIVYLGFVVARIIYNKK